LGFCHFSTIVFAGIQVNPPKIILTCRGFGVGKVLNDTRQFRKGFEKEKHILLVFEGHATVKIIMGCLVDGK